MQEYITVPIDLLIPANQLTEGQMAVVEPLAIGAHAVRRAEIEVGETIVVVGCGPIGIGIIKLAQIAGARVIAIDTNEKRLAYVKKYIGADHIVPAGTGAIEKVAEITGGEMAVAVFDATGHKSALETGTDFMAHGGRYILVGLSKGGLTFAHPQIHSKETTLLCSRNATLQDFEHVISVLENGGFPLDSFISHNVHFRDMISNFDDWLKPENKVIKAMVDF